MNVIKDLLKQFRKGKNVNFKFWSRVALGVCVFFLLGAFVGVDESTKHTLPTILSIAVIGAVVFVAFKLFDKLQAEQLVQEEKERLEQEEKERIEKEEQEKLVREQNRLKEEQLKKEQEKEVQALASVVEADYKKRLNIIATKGSDCFEEEIKKLELKYEKSINIEQLHKLIYRITKKLYFEGDQTIYKILIERMLWYLYQGMMMPNGYYSKDIAECYSIAENQAVAITLRALHFEQYGHTKKGYQSIKTDTCREFFSNNSFFKDRISEDRIRLIANNFDMLKSNVKNIRFSWYLPSIKTEPYYADSLCNAYWKVCVKNHSQELSTDPNHIFDIVYNNLKPSEQDCQRVKEQKIHSQCHACAFCDRCQLPKETRTLNCSGFMPK